MSAAGPSTALVLRRETIAFFIQFYQVLAFH